MAASHVDPPMAGAIAALTAIRGGDHEAARRIILEGIADTGDGTTLCLAVLANVLLALAAEGLGLDVDELLVFVARQLTQPQPPPDG